MAMVEQKDTGRLRSCLTAVDQPYLQTRAIVNPVRLAPLLQQLSL